jgi:hypothetical protein
LLIPDTIYENASLHDREAVSAVPQDACRLSLLRLLYSIFFLTPTVFIGILFKNPFTVFCSFPVS